MEKNAQVVRLYDKADKPDLKDVMELPTPKGTKLIQINSPKVESTNAIKMELELFADSIRNNTRPIVSIQDGYRALKLAYQIIGEMEKGA